MCSPKINGWWIVYENIQINQWAPADGNILNCLDIPNPSVYKLNHVWQLMTVIPIDNN